MNIGEGVAKGAREGYLGGCWGCHLTGIGDWAIAANVGVGFPTGRVRL
jgi:hypothetical protein